VRRRALRDPLAAPLDDVLEAEPRAAQVDAARMDRQPVVEVRGQEVAGVRLERESFDALLAQRRVPAPKPCEVVDPRNLEPDQELGVVRDALGVGLGEPNADVSLEAEAVDARTLER
jgi:hypothetical protein